MDLRAAVPKPMLGTLAFLLAEPIFAAGLASAQVADKKPNVILVLMDNLGWGEPGVYGGGILRGAHPLTSVDGNCRLARATGVTNF